ncbi:hypothetical protein JX266_003994 [Neoarthrinium moseri]|nr:hypothetical protein JX266_003994 [Neoarthrinium moseri]
MAHVKFFPMPGLVQAHLVANCVVMLIAIIVVGFRVLGRFLGIGVGLDDYIIMFGTAVGITLLALNGLWCTIGMGYNLKPTVPEYPDLLANMGTVLQVLFGFQILYLWALALVKLSVLFFYLRVFVEPRTKLAVKITIGIVLLWAVGHTLGMVFACSPIPFQWDPTIVGGSCGNLITLYAVLITTNIITDLMVMALPMHTVWHLKMRMAEKVGLTACLTLGLAVVATTCARLVNVFNNDMRGNLIGTMPTTIFLCVFEVNLGLICVSIPGLRPFYKRYKNHKSSSKISGYTADVESSFKDSKGSKNRSDPGKVGTSAYAVSKGPSWELETLDGRRMMDQAGMTFYKDNSAGEGDNSNDSGSEKRLTRGGSLQSSAIAIETRWAITRD